MYIDNVETFLKNKMTGFFYLKEFLYKDLYLILQTNGKKKMKKLELLLTSGLEC